MLQDNDYEAHFGSQASPTAHREGGLMAASTSVYTVETTLLQQGPRERHAESTSTFSVPLCRSQAFVGWTFTSQWVQPQVNCCDRMDREQASSSNNLGRDFSIDDLPVHDIDDGSYSNVDLNADTATTTTVSDMSSSTDPQLIFIQSQKSHDDESAEADSSDRPPHTFCLSRLCTRFLE